jgi:hypothetical protein
MWVSSSSLSRISIDAHTGCPWRSPLLGRKGNAPTPPRSAHCGTVLLCRTHLAATPSLGQLNAVHSPGWCRRPALPPSHLLLAPRSLHLLPSLLAPWSLYGVPAHWTWGSEHPGGWLRRIPWGRLGAAAVAAVPAAVRSPLDPLPVQDPRQTRPETRWVATFPSTPQPASQPEAAGIAYLRH